MDLQPLGEIHRVRPVDIQAHGPAHHHIGELLGIGLAGGHIADVQALAQHRHPVGNLHDLVELVGDDDDGLAVGLHIAHHVKEPLGLLGRQDGGGLVQNQNIGPAVEDLDDFDGLLLRDRHVVNFLIGVHDKAVLVADFLDSGSGGLQIQPSLFMETQEDVFRGSQDVHQLEVLVNHTDAQIKGVLGRTNGHRIAVHDDFARIGEIDAREHVHQRGLAAAVLAQQGENLAPVDGQVYLVVGDDGAEGLCHASHLDSEFGCQKNHPFFMAQRFHWPEDDSMCKRPWEHRAGEIREEGIGKKCASRCRGGYHARAAPPGRTHHRRALKAGCLRGQAPLEGSCQP